MRIFSLSVVLFIVSSAFGQTFTLEEATVSDINMAFDSGILNSEQLVGLYMNRIDAYDGQGPSLNSIIALNPLALETARALDVERSTSGPRSVLHGIPVLIKDNYDFRPSAEIGMPTTAGTPALANSIPPDNGFMVQKLVDAGAVILGKTNMDELASGWAGKSTVGGQTLNPYDLTRVPLGSSSGTAVGIASNFAVLGLGTETVGSIRLPAAAQSLVGLGPTTGLISRDGIVPLTLTRDTGGPITRTVRDAAIMLDFLVGADDADPMTMEGVDHIPATYTEFLNSDSLQGARIGVATRMRGGGEVREVFDRAVASMEDAGAQIVEVSGFRNPSIEPSTFYLGMEYEMNRYLESLGENAPLASLRDLIASGQHSPHLNFFPFRFLRGDRSREDDPGYEVVEQNRDNMRSQVFGLMDDHQLDVVVYPTAKLPPPKTGFDGSGAPSGENSNLAAFIGAPAMSVPAGFTVEGHPVGLDLFARRFDEPTLIGIAYAFEQLSNERRPPETTPSLPGETIVFGDVDGDGELTVADIDAIAAAVRDGSSEGVFDLDHNGIVELADRTLLVRDVFGSDYGDTNLDRMFDSTDLVATLQVGEYEDLIPLNSGWAGGDWDGNGDFNSGDLVAALQVGWYEGGAVNAMVPEPSTFFLLVLGVAPMFVWRRRRM